MKNIIIKNIILGYKRQISSEIKLLKYQYWRWLSGKGELCAAALHAVNRQHIYDEMLPATTVKEVCA